MTRPDLAGIEYPGGWRDRVQGPRTHEAGGHLAVEHKRKFALTAGVLIVAFSENWQRVGDMAARTLVIDVRKPRSDST